MDEDSVAFNWDGLFPKGHNTSSPDDFSISLLPEFKAMITQETPHPIHRKTRHINESTKKENVPAHTLGDILAQGEYTEFQAGAENGEDFISLSNRISFL